MERLCTKCNLLLDIDLFPDKSNGKYGKASKCKKCHIAYYESRKEIQLNNVNKKRYGISTDQRKQMSEKQRGRCFLCLNKVKSFHLDHSHKTGKVRKLLCNKCNLALGLINDDIGTLLRMLRYLMHYEILVPTCERIGESVNDLSSGLPEPTSTNL